LILQQQSEGQTHIRRRYKHQTWGSTK